MANEMLWSTQSGYLSNEELDMQFVRENQPKMKFRQFCGLKKAFGKNKGESVNWLKVWNAGTYGGIVAETNTIPEATQPLTWGTVSVNEYGLSIPFSLKVEALSRFQVVDIMRGSLMDDAAKVLDGSVEIEFRKTPLRYVGLTESTGTLTTNSVATATNTSSMNVYHLKKMINALKNRNIAGHPRCGGDYGAILSVDAMEGLFTSFESSAVNVSQGYDAVVAGQIARYYGTRLIEDTFASVYTYSATSRSATAISWAQAKSAPGYVFGANTVREAIVVPEGIRMKVETDYGRSKGIAWYGIFGWAIEWATEANATIIRWDSAA
jgi:hypothetical protein